MYEKSILETLNTYDIMPIGKRKNDNLAIAEERMKALGVAAPWAISLRFNNDFSY